MKMKQQFFGAALGATLAITSIASVGLGVMTLNEVHSLSETLDRTKLHLKDSLHKLGGAVDEYDKKTDEILNSVKELNKSTAHPDRPFLNP